MDAVEKSWVAGDFSAGLRTVTTRVTTMGLVAPGLSDAVVAEDRPAFFVVLDFEKNEESDAEGRTIASDIIMDWVEALRERAPGTQLYPDMIESRVTGSPVRSFSHPSLSFRLVSPNLQTMTREDGVVVESKKKKRSKREKGEYMRQTSCPSLSALNMKISFTRGRS